MTRLPSRARPRPLPRARLPSAAGHATRSSPPCRPAEADRAARRDGPASAVRVVDSHACVLALARASTRADPRRPCRGKRRRRSRVVESSGGAHTRGAVSTTGSARAKVAVDLPAGRPGPSALSLAHQIRWCFRGRFPSGKTSFGRFVFPASHDCSLFTVSLIPFQIESTWNKGFITAHTCSTNVKCAACR